MRLLIGIILAEIALNSAVVGAVLACTIAAPSGGGSFPCQPASFNPANPAASGYQTVFSDDFQSVGTSTISFSTTPTGGSHWYTHHFFGGDSPSSDFTAASDGLVINPSGNFGPGMHIQTAAPTSTGQQWVGTVFGRGGYFEATFSFDGPNVVALNFAGGWPSFWSMAIEHLAGGGVAAHVPGQPTGYEKFTEDDFFEYDNTGQYTTQWGSGIHTWYEYASNAVHNPSCDQGYKAGSGSYCDLINLNNEGTLYNNAFMHLPGWPTITWNITTFHTVGHLWVAGDANNSFNGYVQTFFDGIAAEGGPDNASGGQFHPLGKVGWTDPTPPAVINPTTMAGTTQAFAVHDQQNLAVILGSAIGMPFHVKSVRIWQIPGCGTVSH
jgi:hypothetical protein